MRNENDYLKLTHNQLLKLLNVEKLENPFKTVYKSKYYYSLADKLRFKGYWLVVINKNYYGEPIYIIDKIENIILENRS